MTTIAGSLAGYDPGGNGSHGLAICRFENSVPTEISISTEQTAESVLRKLTEREDLVGIGVDTLTYWSSGPSGWRPADRWLRQRYPSITNSIASANSLYGSMGLNGMSVLLALRQRSNAINISETHPKVLWFELIGKKYDYESSSGEMNEYVGRELGLSLETKNDHEWDAVISVLALWRGLAGRWKLDLHGSDILNNERLVMPCGKTNYWWPGRGDA